ncbi:DUF4411 family protein [Algoriphagus sp.]|uniref:DUF4411 family protein n=1 Tax=Algoriphagus sp. TaxID=1872435 RepID=UPI00391A744A
MEIYVLDSNFFIQAHRASYPLDVAFSFWNKVKHLAVNGRIICIDKVKNELYDKNDALEEWCLNNLPEDFFKDTSQIMASYGEISAWAISKNDHYMQNALNEFLDAEEADAFLLAYCLSNKESRIVVTHETSNPNQKNKIKIPEPCKAFGIRFCNTIEMFRRLGETF